MDNQTKMYKLFKQIIHEWTNLTTKCLLFSLVLQILQFFLLLAGLFYFFIAIANDVEGIGFIE